MKAIFITGTDTGVGKTMTSICLAQFLKLKGLKVGIQKWVKTGTKGSPLADEHPAEMKFSYAFSLPASPHLAAELEGRCINIRTIKKAYSEAIRKYEVVIIEGIGGIMVPLRRDYLLIDLVSELALPTLIVTRTKVGTINHTLLTIEALRRREIPIIGVVFNSIEIEHPLIVKDNMRTIAQLGKVEVLGLLPNIQGDEWRHSLLPLFRGDLSYSPDTCLRFNVDGDGFFEAFQPIGERIYERFIGER